MIDDDDLNLLLYEYNLKITKKRKEYLKANADYLELRNILSFLVDELNIDINIIKRYPSILYSTIENVRSNYNFLEDNNLYNYNMELYTNLLSTDNNELTRVYKYIESEYGRNIIEEYPKILCVSSKRISLIELNFKDELDKELLIVIAISKFNIEEIKEIINICNENNIKISKTIFNQDAKEIVKIINVCKENNIPITDSVFYKNSKAIKKMIEICEEQRIYISNSMFAAPIKYFDELIDSCKGKNIYYLSTFFKDNEDNITKVLRLCEAHDIKVDVSMINIDYNELLKIVKVCRDNHVRLNREMFNKTSEEVLENIKFCKEKNINKINEYYFKRNRKELEEVYEVVEKYGLRKEDIVFYRSGSELEEILKFCKDNGYKFEYSMCNHPLSEIKEIIKACKLKEIPLSSEVYHSDHISLGKIVTMFKRENARRKMAHQDEITFTSQAFLRTPTEVERIFKICENRVDITPNIFTLIPFDVDTIIRILESHNIPVQSAFFEVAANELEDIINYCEDNNLKINSEMLFRKKEEIEDILDLCEEKNVEVIDSMYRRKPEEVENIINYCKANNVELYNVTFRHSPKEVEGVVSTCKELGLDVGIEVYKRTPEEIREIYKIFHNLLGIDPLDSSFSKTPIEVEKIIKLLKENDIEINNVVFRKREKELAESIEYIKSYKLYPEKETYKDYLKPEFIIYDKLQLARVFSYLGTRRLSSIKTDSSILKLSIEEISVREAYIYSINESFIVDGKINPIFGYTKKKFQEIKSNQSTNSNGIKK